MPSPESAPIELSQPSTIASVNGTQAQWQQAAGSVIGTDSGQFS